MSLLKCPVDASSCSGDISTLVEPDADTAGIGVVVSFVVTAVFSIAFAIVMTIVDWYSDVSKLYILAPKGGVMSIIGRRDNSGSNWIRNLVEGAMLGLSDTQLITGTALLVAMLQYPNCEELVVYHYNIALDMILISTVTHTMTLNILAGYFQHNMSIFLFRFIFMAFIFASWFVLGWKGLAMDRGTDNVAWPAACYWASDVSMRAVTGSGKIGGTSTTQKMGRILLFLAPMVCFILCLLSVGIRIRRWIDQRTIYGIPYGWILRSWIFQFSVPFILAIVGITHLFQDLQYVPPGTFPKLAHMAGKPTRLRMEDLSQSEWSFGQLVPVWLLLLLAFPLVESFLTLLRKGKQVDMDVVGKANALLRDEENLAATCRRRGIIYKPILINVDTEMQTFRS